MANIKRCDRCQKIYEPYRRTIKFSKSSKDYNGFVLALNYYGYDEDRAKDLCEECLQSLIKWFKNGNK